MVNFLTIKALTESAKAEIIASIIPNEKLIKPGWTIMSIPIMPTMIAAILRALIISPKNIAAPIVINNGWEKLIAVACARGMRVKQVNPAIIPMAPTKPLIKNKLVLFILIAAKPVDFNNGSITIKARRFRKKTTSRTCMFSDAFLMKITMIENKTIDNIFRIIALVWGLWNKKNWIYLI